MLPMSFFDEMKKIAESRAVFFKSLVEEKKWPQFEEGLRDPKFRRAGLRSPVADAKMRRYIRAMGQHEEGTEIKKVQGSEENPYSLREDYNGRVSCSCPSWRYVHSHAGGDCKHVKAYKEGRKK